MRHAALLDRSRTALVLIDLQEGYRPALHRWDRVVAASTVLVRGAAMLDVPLLVTEQYPRGLGHTAAEVASHFPPQLTITEKMSMSCCGAAAFLERLRETRRTQVLIAGIETMPASTRRSTTSSRPATTCTSRAMPHRRVARRTSSRRGTRCAPPACYPRRASRRCSSSCRPPRRPNSRHSSGS